MSKEVLVFYDIALKKPILYLKLRS